MSCSRCTSDFDSFELTSENSVRKNTQFQYPFYTALGEQLVYYTEVQRTNTKPKLPEIKKKRKRNCFSKAFLWCTKERELGLKRHDKKSAKGNETVNLSAFASWLDLKYQEFLKENADKIKQDSPKTSKADKLTSPVNLTTISTTTRTIQSKTPTRQEESNSSVIKITEYPKCCPIYDRNINEKSKKSDQSDEITCLCRSFGTVDTPTSVTNTKSSKTKSTKKTTEKTDSYLIPCGMITPLEGQCPAMFIPCYAQSRIVSDAQSPHVSEIELRSKLDVPSERSKTVDTSTSGQTVFRTCPAMYAKTTATAVNTVAYSNANTMTQTTIQTHEVECVNNKVQTSQHSIQVPSNSYPLFLKITHADKLN